MRQQGTVSLGGCVVSAALLIAMGILVGLGQKATAQVTESNRVYNEIKRQYEYRVEYQFRTAAGQVVYGTQSRNGPPQANETLIAYYWPTFPQVHLILFWDLPQEWIAAGLVIVGVLCLVGGSLWRGSVQ